VLFAHRVNGLPGCWVAVMFNHPSAWGADRIDRLRSACRTAPQTSVTWPTQRLSPGRHNGHEPGGNLAQRQRATDFKQALSPLTDLSAVHLARSTRRLSCEVGSTAAGRPDSLHKTRRCISQLLGMSGVQVDPILGVIKSGADGAVTGAAVRHRRGDPPWVLHLNSGTAMIAFGHSAGASPPGA
jgi:hypothetical protein